MPANKQPAVPAGTFAITRVFDAPRPRVWQAWSEAAQLQSWWGPKGCTLKVTNLEFRPGGFFHYAMQFPNSPPMWGRFMYREIEAPRRIVWLNSFSNEGCGITRSPFGQPFPLELHNEVTLAEQAERTMLTLHAHPHGASEEERAVFDAMFASLEQGFGGTMDKLSDHLAAASK